MSNQLNILLLSLGAVQGWLLGLFLIRKKPKQLAHLYFIAILITISLQMTFKVISKAWIMHHFLFPYIISYTLPFLIGPLLYLQVKAHVNPAFRRTDLLHFLPFVFFALTNGAGHRYDLGWWGWHFGVSPWARAGFQLTALGIYLLMIMRLVWTRKEMWTNLSTYIWTIAAAEFIIIIALAVMYVYYGQMPDARLLFVVLTLLVYWLSYRHMTMADIFSESNIVPLNQLKNHAKYSRSGLKEQEATEVYSRLYSLLQTDKIYLQSNLSIETIASRLGVSRHHLSQVVNERFQKPYFELINEFRLNEVKERLRNPKYRNITIAAIAMDSGFNSVSSFNDLFKKQAGITPSQYREQIKSIMTA